MAKTGKVGESREDTAFGERMIEGLGEARAWRRGEIPLPVHVAMTPDPEWIDEDDAPDLSAPDYQAKLAATSPRRGRA